MVYFIYLMNECPKCNHVIETVEYGEILECEHCRAYFSKEATTEIGKAKNKANDILNFVNMILTAGKTITGETIENFASDKLKQLEKMLSEHCKVTTEETYKVYVIECKDTSKFFVIRSNLDPMTIIKENPCAFTDKYHRLSIHEIFPSSDPLDEDIITKKYMMKFGIDKVRGGSYSSDDLEDWQIKSLNSEFDRIKGLSSNKKSDTDTYLDGFKTVDEIDSEIDRLSNNITKIENIKKSIENTTIKISTSQTQNTILQFGMVITTNQNNMLTNLSSDINDMVKEIIKNDSNYQYKLNNYNHAVQNKSDRRIENAKNDLDNCEKQIRQHLYNTINNIYNNSGLKTYLFPDEKYIQLKILHIRNYNADLKKELNNLIQDYGSDDSIRIKLESLYSKRLKLVS